MSACDVNVNVGDFNMVVQSVMACDGAMVYPQKCESWLKTVVELLILNMERLASKRMLDNTLEMVGHVMEPSVFMRS